MEMVYHASMQEMHVLAPLVLNFTLQLNMHVGNTFNIDRYADVQSGQTYACYMVIPIMLAQETKNQSK